MFNSDMKGVWGFPNTKMSSSGARLNRSFFRCVRTPDVLATLSNLISADTTRSRFRKSRGAYFLKIFRFDTCVDMPDRTRPNHKKNNLIEQELSVVRHKMNQLGTRNFGAYARKMLIDGYIIKVDYTEQKKLAAAVSRIATDINHVCRRIYSTGRC